MFDIAPTELLVVAIVALVIIGPKDLPKVMRTVGHWMGRARGMARHFRSGLDTMMREAELEEMEQKWREENQRIMREHPPIAHDPVPELPAPEPATTETGVPEPAAPEPQSPELPLPEPPVSGPPAAPGEKNELP